MIKYEVNTVFPFPNPMPGAEITISDITTAFFDIKCYISNPSPDEAKDWRKGKITIAIYEYDKCPFCIVKFTDWSLDVSVNVLKIQSEQQREEWLNTEGNIINLFLIDSRTNILKAMRTISVNFSESFRDILEQQTEKYDSAGQVERRIAEIQHTVSTDEMFARAKFKMQFNG